MEKEFADPLDCERGSERKCGGINCKDVLCWGAQDKEKEAKKTDPVKESSSS